MSLSLLVGHGMSTLTGEGGCKGLTLILTNSDAPGEDAPRLWGVIIPSDAVLPLSEPPAE